MSFDLYLQAFQDGKASSIGLEVLRDAFGKYVIEMDDDYWKLQYGVDESSDIFLQPLPDNSSFIHTISIHRPCRDLRLWESLWRLLGIAGTVLYYPSCDAPMARDPRAGMSMPGEMHESLGDPLIVSSAVELFHSMKFV